jgi:serine/threonine protein kinase/Tfp pilus assembly protein PilF
MKTATTVCGRCGAKVSGDATQEVCPACLLESGLGLLDPESAAEVAGPDPAEGVRIANRKKTTQSGRMLADFGDYALLEEIGRGGQGVVYRAYQKSLNRTVALKVIGLGPWTTESHLKRFRREAEAAASLEYPCIVPVYEVGELDGSCYFSMKFVEGGRLDEAVKRTPMSIRRAVELIAKLARTVHYAHEHGVLHRDIKPGNILLDAQGEPLLTDFGLAGLMEAESTITRTLDVMGTPSYMAPEQAAGEHNKLGKATDIYGLGAVLYQLLTDHPPFAGGTTYETIRLLLNTEPRQPRLWNRKIDRDLSTICLKCLEKDPKRRYSSALALAEDLEHWLKHEPIQARRTGLFTRGRKWVQRNPSTAGLIALLVALAVGSGAVVWNWVFAVPMPKSIAVLPFENLSHDPDNAYFADGIQDEILTRLSKIADLKVISRTSTQQYQSKPRNLAQIAKQLGVANVVEGTVQKAGDQIRVNVQLINAQTDSHLWGDIYDRKVTDILVVESEVAKAIADQLQAKLTGAETEVIGAKPTDNPEAYDAYLRGLAYTLKTEDTPARYLSAQKYLKEAVRLDPKFALAWALLSYTDSSGYSTRILQPNDALREEARNAAETALSLQPNLGEALMAKGYYHYACLKDYDTATRYLEQARQLLPNNSQIPEALAYVTRRRGQWDRSEAYFNEAERLNARDANLLIQHANSYMYLRRFPEALRKLDEVLNITPDDFSIIAMKASIAQAQGDLPRAAALLTTPHSDADDSSGLNVRIKQATLERNPAQIIPRVKEEIAKIEPAAGYQKGILRFRLGWLQELASDHPAAQESWQRARGELEPFLKEQPENWYLIDFLALTNMGLGDKAAAFGLLERAMAAMPVEKDALDGPVVIETFAQVAARMGESDRAIAALRRAMSTPSRLEPPLTPAMLRLDPKWDPLRGDPRFQELCKEKQP